jgi:hypothetical protein
VTRWGLLLLVGFLVLGLSGMEVNKAVRFAVVGAVLIVGFVGFKVGGL